MPSRLSGPHEGEVAVREMLKAPPGRYPPSPGLSVPHAARVQHNSLLAVGTLDGQGRPWTTIWGGQRGFAGPVADDVLGLNSAVDRRFDPVFGAFWQQDVAGADGTKAREQSCHGGQGKMMAAMSIDLETRDRVKLAGAFIAGAVVENRVQAALAIVETLGNCPKYVNKKDLVPHDPDEAELVSSDLPLGREALDLIDKADMFFVSSTNGDSMDTNHRGGSPGFVRVLRNRHGKNVELVYPEYSGNQMYQTLGNLKVNPSIGIAIPDFDTADVLYLTGSSSILLGQEASSVIARTQLAVKITVSAARFVKGGLPFRGTLGERSPYNPPIRYLTSEKDDAHTVGDASTPSDVRASLIKRRFVTPTIGVFTFKLSPQSGHALPKWEAGQHISLDFASLLSRGYAHMCDDDPQSLNDDLVRTFTISNPPTGKHDDDELEITARRHGPATGLLWKHDMQTPLDIPVLGFGGEAKFRLPTSASSAEKAVFIAGGVGITPVLAQAHGVLSAKGADFSLLWSVKAEDLPLVEHAFGKIPGLAARTSVFVTGEKAGTEDATVQRQLRNLGIGRLEQRRLGIEDTDSLKGEKRKFYLCAGPGLLARLLQWLGGEEEVVWEDFGY